MDIDGKEIVKVIEACGKSGVSQFKCGELEISFNGFVIQKESDYPVKIDQVADSVVSDPNFGLQNDYEVDGEDMETLMITDPAAYEEKLFKNELEESQTHTDAG